MACFTESGGGQNSLVIENTKNSERIITKQKLVNLSIDTYNIRPMSTDEKINELEKQE